MSGWQSAANVEGAETESLACGLSPVGDGELVAGGDPPARILIAPFGEVHSAHGAFVVDEAAMRATIDAFAAHGTDLPIDFEHQSLGGTYSAPDGRAPAAGWIQGLEAVAPANADDAAGAADRGGSPEAAAAAAAPAPDPAPGDEVAAPPSRPSDADRPKGRAQDARPGLWAQVTWTPPAAEQIRLGQYRYLSPVALVRRSDRRMVGLHSAALTNKPAIAGMPPIGGMPPCGGTPPSGGSPPGGGDDGGHGAAAPATGRGGGGACGGNGHCDGEGECDADRRGEGRRLLAAALRIEAPNDDERLLIAAAVRIGELESGAAARQAEARVSAAASAGRLAASQRGWARELALRDPAAFDAWAASAPLIVPLGRTPPPASGACDEAAAAERRARNEYRRNQALLAGLCSEDAYAADARRRAARTAE